MANTLQLIGAAAVTVGATILSLPAGLIVGGTLLVLLGVAVRK
jgi:hypothetical protein